MYLTVTTPPQSVSLVALPDLKAELGIALTDTSQDARLVRLAATATGVIEGFCGRKFGLASYTESFNTHGGAFQTKRLVLSARPIVSVQSVTEGSGLLPTSGFVFSPESGVLRRCRGWIGEFPETIPGGVQPYYLDGSEWLYWYPVEVVVAYTAGYQLPDDETLTSGAPSLPAEVGQAAIETVKMMLYSGGANVRDPRIRSENIQGVGSTSYLDPTPGNGGLPDFAASILMSFRDGGLG